MSNVSILAEANAEQAIAEVVKNPGVIKTYLESAVPGVLGFLVDLVVAVVILLIGMKLVKSFVKLLQKSLNRGNVEAGVVSFLCSLVRYVLYFVLVMIILSQFGVTTGSVVAVLGSAGLTVGLALQGSLANFAGGVLILLLKPFVVGNYIVDHGSGQEGTVSEISIFYTKLLTVDNRVIMIPNGALSNSTITNVSKMPKRRVDFKVGVAYASDLSKVKAVLQEIALSDEAVLKDETIDVFVGELADSSINMELRVWVNSGDYWTTKWRITERIKNCFDEQGISIPFPQVDVTLNSYK